MNKRLTMESKGPPGAYDPRILQQMLAIASRELAVRQRVYPQWIELCLIEPATARRRLTYMAMIVETLTQMLAGQRRGL